MSKVSHISPVYPDKLGMKASKSIEIIYELALHSVGPADAKRTVSGILASVITELEAANVPVTDDNIAKSLAFMADKFAQAARRRAS